MCCSYFGGELDMTKDVPRYWREIPQRYNLIANECGVCKTVYFPPRVSCPTCRRKSLGQMRDRKLSGDGEIITFSIIVPPRSLIELLISGCLRRKY